MLGQCAAPKKDNVSNSAAVNLVQTCIHNVLFHHCYTVIEMYYSRLQLTPCQPQRPAMCPMEPRPPRRLSCGNVITSCPECGPLIARQTAACRSIFEWNGQGSPPRCTEECTAALLAFTALPNFKDVACCDCGEGASGRICRMTRMKFEASCGKSELDCDAAPDMVGYAPVSEIDVLPVKRTCTHVLFVSHATSEDVSK